MKRSLLLAASMLVIGRLAVELVPSRSSIHSQDAQFGRLLTVCQLTNEFESVVAGAADRLLCPARYPLSHFPTHLVQALIASEDRRFLYHNGVDYWGIARALGDSVWSQRLTGASTLSMQISRILFLSDLGARDFYRKLRRKAWELVLASKIEAALGKDGTIRAYLNVSPLGRGAFGFEAAAQGYFGKSARDLDLVESAMLVGMLPSPAVRDPLRHPDRAIAAANKVIDRMEAQGYLCDDAARQAKRDANRRLVQYGEVPGSAISRYTGPEVRRLRDFSREELASIGSALPEKYRIFVTLSPDLQRHFDRVPESGSSGYELSGIAIGRDGGILAIAGPPYAKSQWNAAWKANRSIGSIGKIPVLLAAAERSELLAQNWSAEDIRGSYSPAEPDHRCRGSMTVEDSLKFSCNRPFVRLTQSVGHEAAAIARRLDLSVPPNHLLLSTGGLSGSPLQVAAMLNMIASGGKWSSPFATLAVTKANGEIVYQREGNVRRVVSRKVAAIVGELLRHPVKAGGTGQHAIGEKRAAAVHGKTGTSDDNMDAIFAGYTNDWTAVFAYQKTGAEGAGMTGGGRPAKDFGDLVDSYWPAKNSDKPGGTASIDTDRHWALRHGLSVVGWGLLWGGLTLFLRRLGLLLARIFGGKARDRSSAAASQAEPGLKQVGFAYQSSDELVGQVVRPDDSIKFRAFGTYRDKP